jgi:hypothetical protein
MSGAILFVQMCRTWRESIPPSLADEDPGLLIDLLGHARAKAGTSQKELMGKLGILQGRLSKLMIKPRHEGWLEDIGAGGADARVRRVRETDAARICIRNAAGALKALTVKSKSRPRSLQPPAPGEYKNVLSYLEDIGA